MMGRKITNQPFKAGNDDRGNQNAYKLSILCDDIMFALLQGN